MKIALCFAGQPRFINLMNFGNLTDGHDVTTYAHFWWDDEYRGDMFAWNSELKYPDDYDPIDHFEQRMKPKQLVWEKYPKFDMSPYKMVSQMEFPLSDDIVRQSIY